MKRPSWWRRLAAKASIAGPAIARLHLNSVIWTPRDYGRLANEGFIKNVIAFRCIKEIARGASSIPWVVRQGKTELEQHPLVKLLANPGPNIGGDELFEAFFAYTQIAGNAYLEGVAPVDGKPPRELWTLRPDRMKIKPGSRGVPAKFEYHVDGEIVPWEVDQVTGLSPIMHFKEFHPTNDWYGLSPLEAAAFSIDQHNAAAEHNAALLQNGARPGGALIFKPYKGEDGVGVAAPPDMIARAEALFDQRYGGPQNTGRTLVFGGDVAYEEMGLSPKDMDFVNSVLTSARDICAAFGVPHVLVVPGEATYNNRGDARLELWENTILPLHARVMAKLNAWLVPQFGDRLVLDRDLDAISAFLPRRQIMVGNVVAAHIADITSREEAREALGWAKEDSTGTVRGRLLPKRRRRIFPTRGARSCRPLT